MTENSRVSSTSYASPTADSPNSASAARRISSPSTERATTCFVGKLAACSRVAKRRLSLQSTQLNALDEIALGKEEDHDDRQDGDHRSRHQQVIGRRVLPLKEGQAERHGEVFDAADVDKRFEKRIPRPPEGENADGCQRRFAERQHDMPQHLRR